MARIDWSRYSHAYGPANDIPALLDLASKTMVRVNPNDEPWFTLWSSLCHQSDVYTASYAALPVLIEMAKAGSGALVNASLHLAAAIEMDRQLNLGVRAPEIPPELLDDYKLSVWEGARLAKSLLDNPGEVDLRVLRGAIEAFNGNAKGAEEILDPAD